MHHKYGRLNFKYILPELNQYKSNFFYMHYANFGGIIDSIYKHRLLLLQMNSLEDRRTIARIIFVFSIMMDYIHSPVLLRKLNFKIPNRIVRTITLLNVDLLSNDPFHSMKTIFNKFYRFFDFNQSINTIRINLKNYFKSNI